MLFTASTGEVAAKDVAADWAINELRLPAPGQLGFAKDIDLRGAADAGSYDMAGVSTLASGLAAQVRRQPRS